MKKSAKYLLVLSCCATLVAVARAQMPPNIPVKWWNTPRVIKELNLNPQQVQRIERIWVENRKNLIDLRAEHDKLQLDLEELVGKPAVEEAALRATVDQLYRAKADIEKATLMMRIKIRDVLTPEQQEKSRALFEQFRQELLEKRNAGEGGELLPGARGARPKSPLRIPPSTIPPSKSPPVSQ
jgi:Spy/CpxP family protein refolding chaperone